MDSAMVSHVTAQDLEKLASVAIAACDIDKLERVRAEQERRNNDKWWSTPSVDSLIKIWGMPSVPSDETPCRKRDVSKGIRKLAGLKKRTNGIKAKDGASRG